MSLPLTLTKSRKFQHTYCNVDKGDSPFRMVPSRTPAKIRRSLLSSRKETLVARKNVWVSPRPDGDWEVQREGSQHPTRVTERKSDAERIARDLARRDSV